jgi:hypothetical protein
MLSFPDRGTHFRSGRAGALFQLGRPAHPQPSGWKGANPVMRMLLVAAVPFGGSKSLFYYIS